MFEMTHDQQEQLQALCQRFDVLRLELFGSAVDSRFDPVRSDLDFLVAFRRNSPIPADDQYFGLLASLEDLFHRKIDLVDIRAARNPYFIASALERRLSLYAA